MSAWTTDRIDLLSTLWNEGLSGTRIAGILGITRGSAIGKIWRLRLPARAALAPRTHRAPRAAKPVRVHPIQIQDDTNCLRVTLADLGDGMCRWPLGDPKSADFRYCGLNNDPNHQSYCGYHAALSYAGPTQRRAHVGWDTRRFRLS
jgi:GcrA cell cycle regulator